VSAGNGVDPSRRRTTRPYRDSALAYGGLGVVAIVFLYLTGSGVVRSLVGGTAAFVLATGWTWWRLRARERAERRAPR
jgi:hypothetical protein